MIRFYKYQGTGNDFIIIDDRKEVLKPSAESIASLCHRRFGIGADGLMLLRNTPGHDFYMVYFNSDGRESSMCGNGGRCIAAFARSLDVCGSTCTFLAIDGPHRAVITPEDSKHAVVSLKMKDVSRIEHTDDGIIMDTGSPHLIRFTDDNCQLNIKEEGKAIRYAEPFKKEGINVNFVTLNREILNVRTYERGVEDETWSCGTGVTASALAYADQNSIRQGEIQVTTPGGNLEVSFQQTNGTFHDIWLKGPVAEVFTGEIDEDKLL